MIHEYLVRITHTTKFSTEHLYRVSPVNSAGQAYSPWVATMTEEGGNITIETVIRQNLPGLLYFKIDLTHVQDYAITILQE